MSHLGTRPTASDAPRGRHRRARHRGQPVDVLRNGDEIFPAMLEAIDGAEHTIDFLTFVYWEGRDRHRVRAAARARGPTPASGCASCSTRWGARTDRPHARSRPWSDAGVLVRWFRPLRRFRPGRAEPPHAPQGADRRRGDRASPAASASPTSGSATPATTPSGATRTSASAGRPSTGCGPRSSTTGPRPTPCCSTKASTASPTSPSPATTVVQCVRGASETGWSDVATLFRTLLQLAEQRLRITTAYFVPDAELTGAPVRRPPIAASRSRSCSRARTPTSASCSSPAKPTYAALLDHGVRDLDTSSRRCSTPRS